MFNNAGVSMQYDALSRLHRVYNSNTGSGQDFGYDGDDLITEYSAGSNTILRRYVHGPGTDEPLIWYEGSGTGTKRTLSADERGSIAFVSEANNNTLQFIAYDDYGNPQNLIGRFGYTGQAWIPEIGQYYYKARIYEPKLGRFVQTDPIRLGDGMNMYAYVGGDPINGTDPTGLWGCDNDDGTTNWELCAGPGFLGGLTRFISGVGNAVTDALGFGHDAPTFMGTYTPAEVLSGAASAVDAKNVALAGGLAAAGANAGSIKGVAGASGAIGGALTVASEVARTTSEIQNGKPTGQAMVGGLGRTTSGIGLPVAAGAVASGIGLALNAPLVPLEVAVVGLGAGVGYFAGRFGINDAMGSALESAYVDGINGGNNHVGSWGYGLWKWQGGLMTW